MSTAKEQITALGGVIAAGRTLGVPATTVQHWYTSDRIPPWRRAAVDAALSARAELKDLTPPYPKAG